MNANYSPEGGNSSPPQPTPAMASFFNSLRSLGLVRAEPRVLGGVFSGVHARWGWDLTLIRVVFVIAAFFFPLLAAMYGVAWFFLAESRDGRIHAEELLAGRLDIAQFGAIALVVVGLGNGFAVPSVFFNLSGADGIDLALFASLVVLAVIAIGGLIAFLVYFSSRNTPASSRPQQASPTYPTDSFPVTPPTSPAFTAPVPSFSTAPGVTMPSPSDSMPDPSEVEVPPQGEPASEAEPTSKAATVDEPEIPSAEEPAPESLDPHPGAPAPVHEAGAASSAAYLAPGPAAYPAPNPPGTPMPPQGPYAGVTPGQPQVPWRPSTRARALPTWVNLLVLGLLTLVCAAVLWAVNYTATDASEAAVAVLFGGGLCLLIVALPMAIAALQDRSAYTLLVLSIVGMMLAVPVTLVSSAIIHDHAPSVAEQRHDFLFYDSSNKKLDTVVNGEWDLTTLPAQDQQHFTAYSVVGDFTILVRRDQPIRIEVNSLIGTLSADYVDPDNDWVGMRLGVQSDSIFQSVTTDKPLTVVHIDSVVGNLVIREVDAPEPAVVTPVPDAAMSGDQPESGDHPQSDHAQSGVTR